MSAVRAPPAKAGDHGLLNLQGIQQIDRTPGEGGGLAVSHRVGRQKSRGPVTPQVGNDDPMAGGNERRNSVYEAVDVIRPAVK